jgi:hypothetical protein
MSLRSRHLDRTHSTEGDAARNQKPVVLGGATKLVWEDTQYTVAFTVQK